MTRLVRPTLLSKIRKLVAVTTERGATEAEAEQAARRVRTLLDRHNLSLLEVGTDKTEVEQVGPRPPVGIRKRTIIHPWELTLANGVAHLYDCQTVLYPYGERIGWVGTHTDTAVCQEVYSAIHTQIHRLRDLYMAGRIRALDRSSGVTIGKMYATGLAQGIRDRIEQILKARTVELPDQLNALVVVKDQAIKKWMAANTTPTRQSRATTWDESAYNAGKRDAARIQIHPAIR
jgi:Protein of unknown function (DUF2786)